MANKGFCMFLCVFFIILDGYVLAKKCLKNGLHEHPTDCAKYYSCAPFGPVVMHCPGGLHFNPRLLVCDWPQDAGCQSHDSECPIYPHPYDCTKFYSCTSSGRILVDCPEGLHFNPQLLVCDWPRNVECPASTTVEPTVAGNEVGDGSTEKYYSTSAGHDIYMTQIQSESLPAASTTPPHHDDDVCSTTVGPHPGDCRKFLMAGPTGNLEFSCPNGLLFNSALLVCDLASNVECPEDPGSTDELFTSISTVTYFDSSTVANIEETPSRTCKGSLWPHPSDCAKFFLCTVTGPVEVACPGELLFNPTWLVCDWPENFECNGVTNSDTTTETMTTVGAGVETVATASPVNEELCAGGFWPHPTDCSKFFMCGSTGPAEVQCPEELLYNPTLSVCDWSDNVECHQGPSTVSYDYVSVIDRDATAQAYEEDAGSTTVENVQKTDSDGATAIIIVGQEDSAIVKTSDNNNNYLQICKGSLWPHPTDCAKFFKCDSSGPVEGRCPEELLFNPALLVCDWPKHVQCTRGTPRVDTYTFGRVLPTAPSLRGSTY